MTVAESLARDLWSTNSATLSLTQPCLLASIRDIRLDLTWVFARDGSLSAMTAAGAWWADCSVPLLAGRALLKSLERSDLMSCYLAPSHAGLLRAAQERDAGEAALLVVVPELLTLRVILACHDFSPDIADHRLWFVAGESWQQQVKQLFDEHPGLPTPVRFIRTKLTSDELVEPMIADGQRIFSDVLSDRGKQIETIRSQPPVKEGKRVLLIGGTRFRLWDEAAEVLVTQMKGLVNQAGLIVDRFDRDNPATSSPLALAMAASRCGMVIAADVSRADAANLVSMETPWVTWVTRPHIPAHITAAPHDALIVADSAWQAPSLAVGWPADRVMVGGWPSFQLPEVFDPERSLAILADTRPIEIPPSVEDLSSHRVLWDLIESELRSNPLALGDNLASYLEERARRLGIGFDALDRRCFFDDLMLPAYQQGLARILLKSQLPLRLYGRGWDQLNEFRSTSCGPITTRAAFESAVAAAAALVHVWPVHHAHPVDSMGKPVVYPFGRPRCESFVRDAKLALTQCPTQAARMDGALIRALSSLLPLHTL